MRIGDEAMRKLIKIDDVLECIDDAQDGSKKTYDILADVFNRVLALPSAEAVEGEWVLKEHLWECDQCGCRINRANPLKGNIWNYNFCPNCGARMKGGEEE